MKKHRALVVGCGGIANAAHFPAYLVEKRVEIAALCDIKRERAEKARKTLFHSAKVYSDYKEALKDGSIDYVDVCVPNYLHSGIAADALNAGKNVLCEKPDAINVGEALKMKAAAEKNGKTLMVIRNNRFIGSSQEIKRLADEGRFGEFYSGRCGWIRRRGIPGKGGWFTTKELSGGGPLIDLGVHMIDLAVWFMGNPKPAAVSGAAFRKFADSDSSDSTASRFGDRVENGIFDVEDLAMGFIRFENGAVLQIEFSWASNVKKECRFVELRGEKAGLMWKNGGAEIFFERNGRQINRKVKGKATLNAHRENIRHFIDVLNGEAEPIFTPDAGIDMIKILSAVYESAATGGEVVL